MYSTLLQIHSILRFVVLILVVIAIVSAFAGWFGRKEYTSTSKKINLFTLISAHTQLLVGLILYFVSPNVLTSNMAAAMKDSTLRYWTVEHISMMIIAIVLVTVGYSKSKKAFGAVEKHRNIAIFYTLAAIIVVVAISLSGRPLLGMSV